MCTIRPYTWNMSRRQSSLAYEGKPPTKIEHMSVAARLVGEAIIRPGLGRWIGEAPMADGKACCIRPQRRVRSSSGTGGCSRRYTAWSRNPLTDQSILGGSMDALTACASRQSWKKANLTQMPSGKRYISFSVWFAYQVSWIFPY